MTFSHAPDSLDAFRAELAERYVIEDELGAGGMAVVYRARDLQRGRVVALKVLRPELGGGESADRFHREIRLVAQLVHPNILPLFDSGQSAGRLWYTMPFIDGESLRARLNREKQLPLDVAIRLTREIAEALGAAHAKGILHRDIKPDNILLADGHALVADFGVARAVAEDPRGRITATGMALGTPGYMSPEQSTADRDVDARSDIYALGSVCYEMLSGEPPFTGPTAQAVIARRLTLPPPSLRTTRPTIPPAVDAAVQRALAPSPADRFATSLEFSRALAAGADPSAQPAKALARPRRMAVIAFVIVAAIAIAAVALGTYRRDTRGHVPAAALLEADGGIRLAVVPFRLIGGDSADRYLADGLSEEINSALSNLGGLRVIAQSSVVPVAAGGKRPRDIATALDAAAIVDGDVQRSGNAVRVRVRLIDPATEVATWSKTFDHTTEDVFQIQSEVASSVASLLRIQLADRESRSLRRPPTTNPAAYDLYLRARVQNDRPGVQLTALDSSIDLATRAVSLDSSFASAWALRASALSSSVFLFGADTARLTRAQADLGRALALDSTNARAWQALADLKWNAAEGWDFKEALADARRALTLEPSLVAGHTTLGSLYFHYGFSALAQHEFALSLSLDPRDACGNETRCAGFSRPRLARVLAFRQQFDSALAVYRSMPFVGTFTWEYAVVLSDVGRPAEGLALLDSTRAPGVPEGADHSAARALIYAALGKSKDARAQIDIAVAHPTSLSHFHHAQFTIASAYARLGDKAKAVDWLERTAANGMPNYPLFLDDPNMRVLHGDPGYERLMARLKQQFAGYSELVRADGSPGAI